MFGKLIDAICDRTCRDITHTPSNLGAWHAAVLVEQRDDFPVSAVRFIHKSPWL
jgi:hypothetical protein